MQVERTFDVGHLDGKIFLVPIRGSFWTRGSRGRYDQERHERLGWRLGRTASGAAVTWNSVGEQMPLE